MMAHFNQSSKMVAAELDVLPQTTSPVQETVEQILVCGKITRANQHVFRAAFLSEEPLTETEQIMINWVFDNLRRGTARVAD